MTLNAEWIDRALCAEVGSDRFFLSKGESSAPAKRICRACSVRVECLDWAMRNNEHGIWGGTVEHEREALRRRDREQSAALGVPRRWAS